MTADKIHDSPSEVAAENGVVVVEGPDEVALLMTPEAAAETSHRLLDAAAEAKGQQVSKTVRKGGAG